MASQTNSTPPPGSVDPITGFWRDLWARSAAGGVPGIPSPAPTGDAFASALMTPESMRRMQAAFFEAMAQYAEQFMRSPQFLEAMKRSMDQAMQFRQQMDDFLKSNLATAFESATGGSNSEILGAIRQSTSRIQDELRSQLATIENRVANLETNSRGSAARGSKTATASTNSQSKSKSKSKSGKRTAGPSRGSKKKSARTRGGHS